MKKNVLTVTVAGLCLSGVLAGCAAITSPFKEPDARWADYKSWTRVTADEVSTGNPTGFLGGVHLGEQAYREVYVNDIAKDTLYGSAPYNYPAGSVIVKEQYANKADWESGRKPAHTVSIKVSASETSQKSDWMWADSLKGNAGESEFCAGCHSVAQLRGQGDFVFTNGDFLRREQ